jgi:myosin-3
MVDELLKHPFLAKVADNSAHLKERLKHLVTEQKKYMVELNKMPEVTTKHGKFKSKRKSKRHSPYTVDDLATLEIFDEDSIVTQLFNRFMQGQIYTYIGDILLAVNPFTELGIYNDEACFILITISIYLTQTHLSGINLNSLFIFIFKYLVV